LANNSTLSTAGNVTHAGAFDQTFTATAITNLTLPSGTDTLVGRNTTDTLTNKTITTSGLLTANGGIQSTQDVSLNMRVFVTGDASMGGRLFVLNDVSMNNRLYVASDVSFNRNFQIFGQSFFTGDVSMAGRIFLPINSIYAGGSLFVGGGGGISAAGDVSFNNRILLTGDASFNSRLYLGSDASFNSRLYLSSDASFNANLYVAGNLAVGRPTVTSGFAVDISGGIQATNYNLLSDYRIKSNVQTLNNSYHVDNLRPVSYYNTFANNQDIGLIAHEIQQHYPYLVHGEKDAADYQSVNYTGIIGVLIHEIQQLKKRVSELESRQ
jgi:predicted acyltransferase (DUF342 family)